MPLSLVFLFFLFLTVCGPARAQTPSEQSNASPEQSKTSFEYKDVIEKARILAEAPYKKPQKIPEFLSKLSYDQWRDIRFKPENALWRQENLPFQVQFFHSGSIYSHPVTINVVESGEVKRVLFSPDMFHYGMNEFQEKIPEDSGLAGFRLHYPLNTPNYYDEVVVFLGANYFKAVGSKQHFGLSARGLGIDTATDSGEEFPLFRDFWLIRPQVKADTITLFALQDSPSSTGAYQFVIKPGAATLIDVTATLFMRKAVKKIGMAPLTSMLFYGENTNIRPVDDYRPEIHNSDGLQITTATEEWIWRPLIDPKRLLVTSFQLSSPKGFGLFQRDIDFDHYQDLGNLYQARPSAWIEPASNWGEGRVELVQIPTDNEKNDNIIAYWAPAKLPEPGEPLVFSYRMRWGPPETDGPPSARVVATRTATVKDKEGKTYLIEFRGGKLSSLPEDARLEANIDVGGAEVTEHHIERNNFSGGWRLVFHVKKKGGALDRVSAAGAEPLELRAFLRQGDEILTETWSYVDPF